MRRGFPPMAALCLLLAGLISTSVYPSDNGRGYLELIAPYSFPAEAPGLWSGGTTRPSANMSVGAMSSDGDSPGYIIARSFSDWELTYDHCHAVDWRVSPTLHFVFVKQLVGGGDITISAIWGSYLAFDPTVPPGGVFSSEVWLDSDPFAWTSLTLQIDIDTTGHAILAVSTNSPTGISGPQGARILWDLAGPGAYGTFLGEFLPESLSLDPQTMQSWPLIEFQEYNGQLITHLFVTEWFNPLIDPDYWPINTYWRRVGDKPTTGGWSCIEIPTSVGSHWAYGKAMASSRVSGKVALVSLTYNDDYCGNLEYVESPDGGVTWPNLEPVRIVDGSQPGPKWLSHHYLDALYDTEGYLHVVYPATYTVTCLAADVDPARIYHWTDRVAGDCAGGTTSLVHLADFNKLESMCGRGGNFAANVAQVNIAQCDTNLVIIWQQYGDPQAGDSLDCAVGDWFPGNYNADLFMSVSSGLDGSLWDYPRNLTHSYSPDCDTTGGFANSCDHDTFAATSRYAMNVSAMGDTYWGSVPEAYEVRDALDPDYPSDGSYLDIRYIDDLYPDWAYWNVYSPVWTYNPIKWFRLPCVDPILEPRVHCSHPDFLVPADWVKTGQAAVIDDVVVENIGNDFLTVSAVSPEVAVGEPEWISISGGVGTIDPGGSAPVEVIINPEGLVTARERLDAAIIIESNDSTNPVITAFEIHTVIADTVIQVVWDTIMTTAGFALTVANQGSAGNNGEGGVNVDFTYVNGTGPECSLYDGSDSPENVYLYDLYPVIMFDGTGEEGSYSWNPFWEPTRATSHDFMPVADGSELAVLDKGHYMLYQSHTFVTCDSSLGCTKYWIAPAEDVSFILEAWKIYAYADSAVSDARIGNVIDWDIPTMTGGNMGGFVNAVGEVDYLYQQGIADPGAEHQPCLDPERRFGASGLLGYYTTNEKSDNPGINHDSLYGGFVCLDRDLYGLIQNELLVDSMWARLDRDWMAANNSEDADQQILLNYGTFDIPLEDTLVIWTVHASVYDGDQSNLQAVIDSAYSWYISQRDHVFPGDGCCGVYTGGLSGNANCSDDGKLTLSDISRLIDYLYISKAELCCYASGNTNGSWDDGDCKITLSDVSKLIDALYISKQPPAECMPECER